MVPETRIVEPRTSEEMAAFRRLNWSYREHLLTMPEPEAGFVRTVYTESRYRAMLDAAETENRPPRGQMRLALRDGMAVGCGTVQTIGPGDAEIKRVYIAPGARGTGLGRALMMRLIDDCRALGFRRILLDTGRPLTSAQALYDSLGFRRRGPYQPLPHGAESFLVFFEMEIDKT